MRMALPLLQLAASALFDVIAIVATAAVFNFAVDEISDVCKDERHKKSQSSNKEPHGGTDDSRGKSDYDVATTTTGTQQHQQQEIDQDRERFIIEVTGAELGLSSSHATHKEDRVALSVRVIPFCDCSTTNEERSALSSNGFSANPLTNQSFESVAAHVGPVVPITAQEVMPATSKLESREVMIPGKGSCQSKAALLQEMIRTLSTTEGSTASADKSLVFTRLLETHRMTFPDAASIRKSLNEAMAAGTVVESNKGSTRRLSAAAKGGIGAEEVASSLIHATRPFMPLTPSPATAFNATEQVTAVVSSAMQNSTDHTPRSAAPCIPIQQSDFTSLHSGVPASNLDKTGVQNQFSVVQDVLRATVCSANHHEIVTSSAGLTKCNELHATQQNDRTSTIDSVQQVSRLETCELKDQVSVKLEPQRVALPGTAVSKAQAVLLQKTIRTLSTTEGSTASADKSLVFTRLLENHRKTFPDAASIRKALNEAMAAGTVVESNKGNIRRLSTVPEIVDRNVSCVEPKGISTTLTESAHSLERRSLDDGCTATAAEDALHLTHAVRPFMSLTHCPATIEQMAAVGSNAIQRSSTDHASTAPQSLPLQLTNSTSLHAVAFEDHFSVMRCVLREPGATLGTPDVLKATVCSELRLGHSSIFPDTKTLQAAMKQAVSEGVVLETCEGIHKRLRLLSSCSSDPQRSAVAPIPTLTMSSPAASAAWQTHYCRVLDYTECDNGAMKEDDAPSICETVATSNEMKNSAEPIPSVPPVCETVLNLVKNEGTTLEDQFSMLLDVMQRLCAATFNLKAVPRAVVVSELKQHHPTVFPNRQSLQTLFKTAVKDGVVVETGVGEDKRFELPSASSIGIVEHNDDEKRFSVLIKLLQAHCVARGTEDVSKSDVVCELCKKRGQQFPDRKSVQEYLAAAVAAGVVEEAGGGADKRLRLSTTGETVDPQVSQVYGGPPNADTSDGTDMPPVQVVTSLQLHPAIDHQASLLSGPILSVIPSPSTSLDEHSHRTDAAQRTAVQMTEVGSNLLFETRQGDIITSPFCRIRDFTASEKAVMSADDPASPICETCVGEDKRLELLPSAPSDDIVGRNNNDKQQLTQKHLGGANAVKSSPFTRGACMSNFTRAAWCSALNFEASDATPPSRQTTSEGVLVETDAGGEKRLSLTSAATAMITHGYDEKCNDAIAADNRSENATGAGIGAERLLLSDQNTCTMSPEGFTRRIHQMVSPPFGPLGSMLSKWRHEFVSAPFEANKDTMTQQLDAIENSNELNERKNDAKDENSASACETILLECTCPLSSHVCDSTLSSLSGSRSVVPIKRPPSTSVDFIKPLPNAHVTGLPQPSVASRVTIVVERKQSMRVAPASPSKAALLQDMIRALSSASGGTTSSDKSLVVTRLLETHRKTFPDAASVRKSLHEAIAAGTVVESSKGSTKRLSVGKKSLKKSSPSPPKSIGGKTDKSNSSVVIQHATDDGLLILKCMENLCAFNGTHDARKSLVCGDLRCLYPHRFPDRDSVRKALKAALDAGIIRETRDCGNERLGFVDSSAAGATRHVKLTNQPPMQLADKMKKKLIAIPPAVISRQRVIEKAERAHTRLPTSQAIDANNTTVSAFPGAHVSVGASMI